MGQTLNHGVYLPAEGERNCYSGLASNWNLLDTAIGDIAGKASATHTHGNITNDGKVGTTANLPLITGTGGAVQAGAFGNAANTFCEGNDSRLSDARTPVAHTHTKSDVTDLLNSNFIPSANNSYDLGSASYQWNNLYAKNYYYNGTAWGLDKANEWTGQNTFKTTVTYDGNFACYWKRANLTAGTLPSSTMYYGSTRYADSAGTTIVLNRGLVDTSGKNYFRQYTYAFNDTSKYCSMGSGIDADGSNSYFAFNAESVIPGDNNTTDLGTSTNKWKSLNGINPGALSLPNTSSSVNMDTTNWDKRPVPSNGGLICNITPSDTGWICVQITREKNFGIWAISSYRQTFTAVEIGTNSYGVMVFIPAIKSIGISLYTNGVAAGDNDLIFNLAKFYPCLGNV